MKQTTQHIPLRLSSNPRNKMSSTLASTEDLAHSQTSPAIPPSTTESPDMAGPTETIEVSKEDQVETQQEHILSTHMPVVDQATKCDTPEPDDSLDKQTTDTSSSTPAKSSDLPGMATPRSSISPEPEVTQSGAGSNRSKRPHEAMAGPLPNESRKAAKLSELLFGTQDVEHSFAEGSSDGQTPKTGETSHIASVGSVEQDEEEEEMPTKKRVWKKAGLTSDALDTTALPSSSFDFTASAGPVGEDEEEMPRKKGVARKVGLTRDALHPTFSSRSSSSVLKTKKRPRVAVESDEEDEDEPPTKKQSTTQAELTREESPDLTEDPEPTDLSQPSFDFKASGLTREVSPDDLIEDPEPTDLVESISDYKISESTIYSKETPDPRRRSPQRPRESDPPTATTPSQPRAKSYLHLLPGELRNRIYTHLGLRSGRLNLETLQMPSLMVAYPDLKNEMLSIILSDNKLRVPVFSDFRIKASEKAKKPNEPSSVGKFQAGTVAIDPENWVMGIDPHFVTIKHICMRILEAPKPDRPNDLRPICDYFLNVRVVKGQPEVSHKASLMASTATQCESRAMCDLATARAKRLVAQADFVGFSWKQVQEIAASFESVLGAKAHFTKEKGKVLLNE